MAVLLLVLSMGVLAPVDWWSVGADRFDVERFAKPLVMLGLLAAVVAADPSTAIEGARWWFATALVLSLVGDIALLRYFDQFLVGLVAFLLAHVGYIVGMLRADVGGSALSYLGLVVVVLAVNTIGARIARSAGNLQVAVWVYVAVISGLVVAAAGTGSLLAFAGALLFYASDGLLGWGRFLGAAPGGRVAVHATYHLGQGGLVAWLVVA